MKFYTHKESNLFVLEFALIPSSLIKKHKTFFERNPASSSLHVRPCKEQKAPSSPSMSVTSEKMCPTAIEKSVASHCHTRLPLLIELNRVWPKRSHPQVTVMLMLRSVFQGGPSCNQVAVSSSIVGFDESLLHWVQLQTAFRVNRHPQLCRQFPT